MDTAQIRASLDSKNINNSERSGIESKILRAALEDILTLIDDINARIPEGNTSIDPDDFNTGELARFFNGKLIGKPI
jgi:hypothetical protein